MAVTVHSFVVSRKQQGKRSPGAAPAVAPAAPAPSVPPPPNPAPRLAWIIPLVIVAVGIAAYANSFGGVFLYDDEGRIVANTSIRQLWPLAAVVGQSTRPLVEISLAANYALGGLDVRGYHAFNLAIHLAAALALYGVVRRMLTSD